MITFALFDNPDSAKDWINELKIRPLFISQFDGDVVIWYKNKSSRSS